ncbi:MULTISPECIES: hypothetical protein [Leuconostoc]|uniref:hypothetical protein n=1 Tax=Leuconostoc TaxID=1243 RepID=UPI00046177A2|nr:MULTISPECIES: hypothetical protein [Leuconostoc]KDA49018.1 hypothetical protein L965_111 [Leuconostoc pseudomesenteroides PS12]QQB00339.1 hypothetical protein I6H61_00185 [Leuconostoc pseudomesenteroides]KDA49142.1 hypothetical protein L965_1633 [Leuconostoc pseudomesenteroides PS12]MDG9745407.1 hypothetical protein [Leuconostoc falkenbergense]QQB02316.1 hypothetical protein I6H61_10880 [Leuconostoc pseudomesenteroides]
MTENYDDINDEKFTLLKDALLKAAEEFLYDNNTTSSEDKIQRLVRLVNKNYDI